MVRDGLLQRGTSGPYRDPRRVFSIELDAALARQAQQRLDHVVGKGTTIHIGNGLEGFSQAAPYDGIIATGSHHKVPLPWLDQLQGGEFW